MKESFGHDAHLERGETLAKRAEGIPMVLPITDSRVQVYLARYAFPGDATAMEKWLAEDADGETLSGKFRAYIEDSARTPQEHELDVNNSESLATLYSAVRDYVIERTVH